MAQEVTEQPQVLRSGVLDIQVCVPADWTDQQVETYANLQILCGTSGGWKIRREGDELLAGCPERVPCSQPEREGFVHIVLDA